MANPAGGDCVGPADAAQTHVKNNYMRNPLAMDVFNEEICTLLKKKIKASLESIEDLSIRFSYEGEVSLKDSEEILQRITGVHEEVRKAGNSTKLPKRKEALLLFAENLARSFYGFEPDFFQQNVSRIVDDVISQIHASLEIWPMLVEICYFHKDKREFPQRKVMNRRLKSRNGSTARNNSPASAKNKEYLPNGYSDGRKRGFATNGG